jgi:hypothetical protein
MSGTGRNALHGVANLAGSRSEGPFGWHAPGSNMTETSCVTAISERGRERNQHGNGKRLGSSGRSISSDIGSCIG